MSHDYEPVTQNAQIKRRAVSRPCLALLHIQKSVDWWADYAFARATSPSTFDPRNVGNVERGGEVSPSTRGTIFSGFRRLSTQRKAGDERQLREVSYFNLFSLWEMKRRSQSAKCQRTDTRASGKHTPATAHALTQPPANTHPPAPQSKVGEVKKKKEKTLHGSFMWAADVVVMIRVVKLRGPFFLPCEAGVRHEKLDEL